MKTYTMPGCCLDCALPVQGTEHCPRCGLPQTGPDAARLLAVLSEADTLLRMLDGRRMRSYVPAPLPPHPPVAPPLRHAQRPRRQISVGSVLLGLGALCLVVAGIVFVAVTWGSLSLSTRTLVLLGVTAVAFAVAGLLTVRRLHASVEAVSAVAWLFLAVDIAAARATGLLGLDRLDLADVVLLSGLVAAVPASVVAVLTHRLVGREPVVTSAVTAAGWWLVGASYAWQWQHETAWLLVVLVVSGAALGLGYRALGSLVTGWLLLGMALALHGLLWLEAVRIAVTADVDALLRDGLLWPVVATMALTVAAAETLRRWQAGSRTDLVVSGAGLSVALLAAAVLVAPAWQADPTRGVVALCLVTLALAATGVLPISPWTVGPRALVAVGAIGCALVALPWVTRLGLELAVLAGSPWGHPIDAALPGVGSALDSGLPLWTASAALVTIAMTCWLVTLGVTAPLPTTLLRGASLMAAWAAVSLSISVLTGSLPVVVAYLVLPGLVLLAYGETRDTFSTAAVALGAAGLAGGCMLAVASVGLSLVVWSVGLVAAGLMAFRSSRAPVAGAWAAAAVVLGTGVTGAVVELLEGEAGTQTVVLALVLALTLVATVVLPARDLRHGVVLGVAVLSVVPVVLALEVGLARISLVLTVLGVAAAGIGVTDARRRPSALVGALSLAVAWWLRLLASDIGVVEAYTLPLALVLVAVGLVPVLRRSAPTLPTLMPGLTLAMAPSLPLTIAEPGSLRGMLVLAAAATLLAAGVALRWAAPFVVGAVAVALVAVVHLGPYVDATPRWAALAALGLAMLVVGVTWESRVRDLRSAAAYVEALR